MFNEMLHKLMSFKISKKKSILEKNFWTSEVQRYIDWYSGNCCLYGIQPPEDFQKMDATCLKDSAILTWFTLHQKPKYLHDLSLLSNSFIGERLLDIGSGPFPSALVFEGCSLFCLDPLLPDYIKVGFPIHYYDNVKFIHAHAEDIPVKSGYFDAVISVNAIDHVDNLQRTSLEIARVLKFGGKFAMHVHYHKPTPTEPIQINDQIFSEVFGWCQGLRKISVGKSKMGYTLTSDDEIYALWRNF